MRLSTDMRRSTSALAMVLLPLPLRPVKNTQKPRFSVGGCSWRRIVTTSGKLNQLCKNTGTKRERRRRTRNNNQKEKHESVEWTGQQVFQMGRSHSGIVRVRLPPALVSRAPTPLTGISVPWLSLFRTSVPLSFSTLVPGATSRSPT